MMKQAKTSLYAALGLGLALGGCQRQSTAERAEEISSQNQSIVNGTEWAGDPATVALTRGFGASRSTFCTGSLIRPNVVLTAAHCVVFEAGEDAVVTPANQIRIVVGATDNVEDEVEVIQVAQVYPHRGYSPFAAVGAGQDIALLRLAEDAQTAPVDFNRVPLTNELHQDLAIRIVGYGNDDGFAGTGSGVKRIANGLRIARIRDQFIDTNTEGTGASTCQGDSGGPTFGDPDGNGEVVLAVTSFGTTGCIEASSSTRTDFHLELIDAVLAAWTGPCAFDGTCVESGCGEGVVDPDCDPCGLNGFCEDGCPQVDLDCPVGKLAGTTCGESFECEDRNCIAADDDPTITFCTKECDPNGAVLEECDAPLTACEEADDGKFYCGYAGPTPRALGATCSGPSDCNSGLCDTSDEICVVPCPSEGCPDGFECRNLGGEDVCALPGGGGGCQASSGGFGALGLGLLGFALVFARRRR